MRLLAASALLVFLVLAVQVPAQRGPTPDPLIREGVTVKLGPHTYAIPDGNVPLVPNVGLVVGTRAALVIDTGLGRRNGETILRELGKLEPPGELYIVTTHFHGRSTAVQGSPHKSPRNKARAAMRTVRPHDVTARAGPQYALGEERLVVHRQHQQ